MRINLSWALGFKVCTLLYAVGLVGAVLLPSRERPQTETEQRRGQTDSPSSNSPVPNAHAPSEPMTRAVLDGIYFDVVRATGQGDQLEIEMRAHNTGPDRNITPGRAKGILEPALFATIFDEQGGKWYADQVRIANVTSTSGYLPQSKLISGVPTAMVLTFARMPAIAGALQIRTIPRLEIPIIVGVDEPQPATGQGQAVVLLFRQIPVEGR
jgi:hypothetical protein